MSIQKRRNTANDRIAKAIKRDTPLSITSQITKVDGTGTKSFDDIIDGLVPCSEEYLNGDKVSFKRVWVEIASLRFWLSNPRLFDICGTPPTSQEEVIEALMQPEHKLSDLCMKLLANGGLPDPLIVVPEDDDKFGIREGNRRGGACMLLTGHLPIPESFPKHVQKAIAKAVEEQSFPKEVPVVLYKDMTPQQLQKLLSINHNGGKKEWTPLGKAQWAYSLLKEYSQMDLEFKEIGDLRKVWHQLSTVDQEKFKNVAEIVTWKGKLNELRYRIQAFCATCLYCRHYDTGKQRDKFDAFRRFYSQRWWRDMAAGVQPRIRGEDKKERNLMYADEHIEEKLMQWIADEKIKDTLQVGELHKIIDDPETRKVFEEKGFKAANDLYEILHPDDGDQTADPEEVFMYAHSKLKAMKPESLGSEKVRKSLHALKVSIAQLEAFLGEAL